MRIIISKGKNRNTLTCKRVDGTSTSVSLGPNVPHHDIAHFVIEKEFDLKKGFYGNIKAGLAIDELSDKEVIKNLDPESWLSEIMTRNLQSVGSGAAKLEQFIELVNWEAQSISGIKVPELNLEKIKKIESTFNQLCHSWKLIPENGELSLEF